MKRSRPATSRTSRKIWISPNKTLQDRNSFQRTSPSPLPSFEKRSPSPFNSFQKSSPKARSSTPSTQRVLLTETPAQLTTRLGSETFDLTKKHEVCYFYDEQMFLTRQDFTNRASTPNDSRVKPQKKPRARNIQVIENGTFQKEGNFERIYYRLSPRKFWLNPDSAQEEFMQFLEYCTRKFHRLGTKHRFKYAFLPNGQELTSLQNIPNDARRVYVSVGPFFQGQKKFEKAKSPLGFSQEMRPTSRMRLGEKLERLSFENTKQFRALSPTAFRHKVVRSPLKSKDTSSKISLERKYNTSRDDLKKIYSKFKAILGLLQALTIQIPTKSLSFRFTTQKRWKKEIRLLYWRVKEQKDEIEDWITFLLKILEVKENSQKRQELYFKVLGNSKDEIKAETLQNRIYDHLTDHIDSKELKEMISMAFTSAVFRMAKCNAVIKPKALKDTLLDTADEYDESTSILNMYKY